MKSVNFRNSSQLIHSILTGTTALNDTSIELSFSTFRSEDYHCSYYLPYATDRESQLLEYELADLTQSLSSDDSQEQEVNEVPEEHESQPINVRRLCFRNKKETIDRVLNLKKAGPTKKPISFRNSSSTTSKYLTGIPKLT